MGPSLINMIFFAFLFGVGVFFIVIAPSWGRAKRDVDRIDELTKIAEAAPSGDVTLTEDIRKRGLEKAIAQAGLPVTPAQFLRFGALTGIASASLILSLIGSPLVAGFVGLGSIVLYVRWLYGRRDQMKLDYEEALGSACEYMATGAQRTGTVEGALSHAVDLVDPILRDDFIEISGMLSQNEGPLKAFRNVQGRRQSQALNMMAETLNVWSTRGSTQSLKDVLKPLRLSIQKNAATHRKVDAELSGPKRTMIIVAVAPILFAVMMRLSSPAFARYYASLQGEILQIVAYSIAFLGLFFGERALGNVKKAVEIDED